MIEIVIHISDIVDDHGFGGWLLLILFAAAMIITGFLSQVTASGLAYIPVCLGSMLKFPFIFHLIPIALIGYMSAFKSKEDESVSIKNTLVGWLVYALVLAIIFFIISIIEDQFHGKGFEKLINIVLGVLISIITSLMISLPYVLISVSVFGVAKLIINKDSASLWAVAFLFNIVGLVIIINAIAIACSNKLMPGFQGFIDGTVDSPIIEISFYFRQWILGLSDFKNPGYLTLYNEMNGWIRLSIGVVIFLVSSIVLRKMEFGDNLTDAVDDLIDG